jgi:hypothetical protein
VHTGVDLHALQTCGNWICAQLGRESNSRVGTALARKRAVS